MLKYSSRTRDCNPGIPNTGIPDLFINPEIPGLGGPNPGIGNSMNLKCKFLKIVDCDICGFTFYGPVIYLLLILSMG
jgi:hypothetical protein